MWIFIGVCFHGEVEPRPPPVSFSSSTRMASGRLKSASGSAVSSSRASDVTVTQNYEVMLPNDTDWDSSYFPTSLHLTLEDIVEDCKVPNKHVLDEFPYSGHQSALETTGTVPPSPSRPQAHLDPDKLKLKQSQLKSLIRFYKKRIHWLSTNSRLYFGHLKGSNVALLVEPSSQLSQDEEEYQTALRLLVDEQLIRKETVYLIQFGSEVHPTNPECLHFSAERNRCSTLALHWLSSLGHGGGSCDLLGALKVALRLKEVDTIFVVLSSRPNQPFDVILDHVVERLSGCDTPRLHLVAFNNTEKETATFLSRLAAETGGHFHEFTSIIHEEEKSCKVVDTNIVGLEEEIKRTKKMLHQLKTLKSGVLEDPLVEVLRELSLTTEWPEDDDFLPSAPPSGTHFTPCSSQQWLKHHGLASHHRLDLYQFLAPNAYPQLDTFVDTTERRVSSQVYEVMPLFEWCDGSHKYLHVDVPLMEQYQRKLKKYVSDTLQVRLNWLLSGSRVPFGVITEQRVLVALDCSQLVLTQTLVLQQHFRTLLEQQLSHVRAFNLLRFGKECCTWKTNFVEPSRSNLLEAWEWMLGMSPAGSCDLLSALRLIFETITEDEMEDVGIYLIVSTMPDQDMDTLCSYVEQQVAGKDVTLHTIFYDMEPLTTGLVIPGRDGGRWGDEEEIEECLRQITRVGGGRFHHFKLSGSVQGDDISAMMDEICKAHFYLQTARSVVEEYRQFCKRNVSPSPPPLPGGTLEQRERLAPPLHPRQTNASLARMNACLQHLSRREEATHSVERRSKLKSKYIKTTSFYLDQGIRKGVAWELLDVPPPSRLRKRPLIPNKEEHISSKEWISKYGLEKLGLCFEKLVPGRAGCHGDQDKHRTVYKHINHHGEVVDLHIDHQGLRGYVKKLQTAMTRYQSRLEWLLDDAHKFFGVILEKKVLFLLDVSSSMAASLQEVVEALTQLLLQWNTCPTHRVKSFNIVMYASTVAKWQEKLVPLGEDLCTQAVQWLQTVKAGGASCLLEALKVSLQSGATGIYLVTDGVPDHTHEFLLNQLPLLRQSFGDGWKLNTVAVHCSDQCSTDFLKSLAAESGGRYHCYPLPSDLVAKQQNLGSLAGEQKLGDDIKLVAEQIRLAQNYLGDARNLL